MTAPATMQERFDAALGHLDAIEVHILLTGMQRAIAARGDDEHTAILEATRNKLERYRSGDGSILLSDLGL